MTFTNRNLRKRIAHLLTGSAIIAALSMGLTTPASAAEGGTLPPAASIAAPAQSDSPNVGNSQHYWATDGCHYFADTGRWWSDMCLRALADVAGNVIPNSYGTYQNLGDGQLGILLTQIDTNDPNHIVFATRSLSYHWYRTTYGTSPVLEQLATTSDGRPIWITPPTYPATQPGGPPATTGDPVKDQQNAKLWDNYLRAEHILLLTNMDADISIRI